MQTQTLVDKDAVEKTSPSIRWHFLLPFVLLLGMMCAIFVVDAVLPLRGLGFSDALLTHFGSWPLLPTHLLFPNHAVFTLQPPSVRASIPAAFAPLSKSVLPFLFVVLLSIFLLYLLAIRFLPRSVTHRFILGSTLLLGLLYALTPVVTSQDLFLYIGYARMSVIYHLNPLATPLTAIHADPAYRYIYWLWSKQASIYGPTWAIAIGALQWLALVFGFKSVSTMVLLLRFFCLGMHLCSTYLIWLISGRLQKTHGFISPRLRTQATLAFAWNPLLLLEACVNAHSDTMLLVFVLLALLVLVSTKRVTLQAGVGAAVMFALATCLKVNIALLVPGLLLFLWTQHPRGRQRLVAVTAALIAYVGTTGLFYALFWQHGAVLQVFQTNPATYGYVNSLFEVVGRLYIGLRLEHGYSTALSSAMSQRYALLSHKVGSVLFIVVYGCLCAQALYASRRKYTLSHLIRWMVVVWLLYCLIGSPWFWPWYLITFFGLFSLIEATSVDNTEKHHSFNLLRLPLAVRLLTFSMLSLYCFSAWWPLLKFVPGLPGFHWSYFSGLWVWLLPLLAVRWHSIPPLVQQWRVLYKLFLMRMKVKVPTTQQV